MIYLDNNATTRPLPEVADAMDRAVRGAWANPSSVHRPGQDVRRAVELARAQASRLINARPRELVFTSGGTESIELAIRGRLDAHRAAGHAQPNIVTTAVEHAAVRDLAETLGGSVEVRLAPLLPGGVIDPDALGRLIDESTAIVSIQWANNETGAIQPVQRVGELCRAQRAVLHVDGTQWVGKMPTDFGSGTARRNEDQTLDDAGALIDLLTFSPHKFHGPKGVGVLAIRRGTMLGPVRPGSQELGRRGGTENVPGIVGLGAACEAAAAWLDDPAERDRLAGVRDRFESAVLAACPDAVINRPGPADAAGPERLWNTSNVGFPGIEAEPLLLMLSEQGVCASAGAACSSGSLEPSPVLLAMGIQPRIAHGSVRFSLSRETDPADVEAAATIVARCAGSLGSALPTG